MLTYSNTQHEYTGYNQRCVLSAPRFMLWRTTIIFYFFHFRRFVFALSLSPSPVCLFAFGSLPSTLPLISMTGRWPQ